MHKLKKLMKEAAAKRPEKLADLLMDEVKDVNASFMYELDLLVNGEEMSWECAEEAVEDMEHDNGKHGERFSKETTKQHARRFDIDEEDEADFYYVMNMMYSDYCQIVGEDENRYAEFARKFIEDKDGPKGKAKKYYYAMKE